MSGSQDTKDCTSNTGPNLLNQKMSSDAAGGLGWTKMPRELLLNVMQCLDATNDLKACRLVNKRTSDEAARVLFHTLPLTFREGSFERARSIMASPLADHVRGIDYGRKRWWRGDEGSYFEQASVSLQQLRPNVIFLTGMHRQDTQYLHSTTAIVERLLSKTRHFKFTFNNSMMRRDLWPSDAQGFRGLVQQLSMVSNLHLGFEDRTPIIKMSIIRKNIAGTGALLQGFYPRLIHLTLENVLDSNGSVLSFLKQHKKTLKALTFRNLRLTLTNPAAADNTNGLAALIRFVLLLNQDLELDSMAFLGTFHAGAVDSDRPGLPGFSIQCRQKGEPISAWGRGARGIIRHKVEEFICRRAEFPFRFLLPYATEILGGSLQSNVGEFLVEGDSGISIRIIPEHDDTWEFDDGSAYDHNNTGYDL